MTFGEAEATAQQFTVQVPLVLNQLKKDAMKARMADPQINFDLLLELQPVKLKSYVVAFVNHTYWYY